MRRLFRTPPFPTVFAVGFFQEIAFFLLVNLPGRLQQLGFTEAGIGVAYSVSALAALLLRPLLGRVLDVFHRRTVLRVAGILNITAIAVLALVDVAGPVLWAAFLAQRVLQILLFTTILTYAADCVPQDIRTLGIAVFGMSGLIPIALANLMGDALLNELGYQGLLTAAGAVALVSWSLVWRLPLLPVLGSRPRRNFWAVVRQPDLMPVWWISLMFAMAMETIFVFMRPFIDARQVGSLGLFFVVYGTLAILTRLIGGRLTALPARRIIVAAMGGMAAGMAVLGAAFSLPLLLGAAALLGGSHGVIFPIISAQVVDRARTSERGTAVATFTSVFDLGLIVCAPIVGAVIERFDYGLAFGAVGLTVAGGTLVFAAWDRRLEAHLAAADRAPAPLGISDRPDR
ncbi:MAG TPA: MFS transporter [Acidimicrobiia bacterium]|nr:MFS transporter [Acidimicrobiia bacterium]